MRTVLLALLLWSGNWQLAPTAAAVRPMQGRRDTLGYRVEDVRYPSDQLTLAADLLLPARSIRVPGAVINQGSGTSDRTNRWARDIAEALVHRGLPERGEAQLPDRGDPGGGALVAGSSEPRARSRIPGGDLPLG
jgi:hypothetical protein